MTLNNVLRLRAGSGTVEIPIHVPNHLGGWNVHTARHTQTLDVTSEDGNPRGVFLKPDGTKLYMAGRDEDAVFEYDLSTPWDVTSATLKQRLDPGWDFNPSDIYFRDDGKKLYIIDGDDDVQEWDLGTAWDTSTGSIVQQVDLNSEDSIPLGLFFKSDGTKMYMGGRYSGSVYEYTLSTAWDISTLSLNHSTGVSDAPTALFFRDDGHKMYYVCVSEHIHEYDLSTAWDLSTKNNLQEYNISDSDLGAEGIHFRPDGTQAYVSILSGDRIFEYQIDDSENISLRVNASDGVKAIKVDDPGWDVSTASYVQKANLLRGGDDVQADVFFKPDGTKIYILEYNQDIWEYDLGTAWDLSTTTYNNNSTTVVVDSPSGMFMGKSGSKLYLVDDKGTGTDGFVSEHTLSTAWDISTESQTQTYGVGSEDEHMVDVSFKPDGTKMYTVGFSNDNVYEYDLSTAWDISTASYNQAYSVGTETTLPLSLFFKEDGGKMYVWSDTDTYSLYEYDLKSNWNISTASLNQSLDTSQFNGIEGFYFGDLGQKMYAASSDNNIYEYTLERGVLHLQMNGKIQIIETDAI